MNEWMAGIETSTYIHTPFKMMTDDELSKPNFVGGRLTGWRTNSIPHEAIQLRKRRRKRQNWIYWLVGRCCRLRSGQINGNIRREQGETKARCLTQSIYKFSDCWENYTDERREWVNKNRKQTIWRRKKKSTIVFVGLCSDLMALDDDALPYYHTNVHL